jgi:hypothetical protein
LLVRLLCIRLRLRLRLRLLQLWQRLLWLLLRLLLWLLLRLLLLQFLGAGFQPFWSRFSQIKDQRAPGTLDCIQRNCIRCVAQVHHLTEGRPLDSNQPHANPNLFVFHDKA